MTHRELSDYGGLFVIKEKETRVHEASEQDSNLPTDEADEFEATSPGNEFTQPPLNEEPPVNYYDQPSPYDTEDPTDSAFTDSGEWFQDFDTSHIYNTYGFQPDYNYGGRLPNEWYYNNAGKSYSPVLTLLSLKFD